MTAAAPAAAQRGTASVLRHRDFRLFWIGAFISNIGTWLQTAAVPYVLFKLTDSNVWAVLSVVVVLLPGVIVGPTAGALADRVDRRKLLVVLQIGSAIAAFALAIAWAGGVRRPIAIVGLVAVSGVLMGLGMPTWQGFVSDLVPRSEMPAAIALNSMQFHGSCAVGPALAGVLLKTVGPTWAFIGNAVSFGAVIIALMMVRTDTRPRPGVADERTRDQLRAGIVYARGHAGIATALSLVVCIGFLGNPIVQLAPAFSERIYKVGAGQYGLLTGAFGLGAAVGVYLTGQLTRTHARSTVLLASLLLLGAAILGFGLSPNYPVGLVCVLVAGSTAVGSGVLLLTSVQTQVDDAYRGRVLGLYGMAFTASYPIGALLQGVIADAIGPRTNEIIVGCIVLVLGALLVTQRERVRSLDICSEGAVQ